MRVLVLGAGASICAGYPKAEDLFDALKQDEYSNGELGNPWGRWTEVVNGAPAELKPLLTAKNPEIVLSFLDLCEMFISENFDKVFPGELGRKAASQSLDRDRLDSNIFSNLGHAWLYNAGWVKSRLVHLLGAYFMWKHIEDSRRPDSRAYMRSLLSTLKKGDKIVTFNWDTIVERTLLELGRWSPADGYGFTKSFRDADEPEGLGHSLPEPLSQQSEISVLKLHGSVGWRSRNRDNLSFDGEYLDYLLPEPLRWSNIADADARPFQDSFPHVLAYPSFLKQLENRFILDIWRQADEALRTADEVEIWGYSLPPSDAAAHMLLQSLRWRARTGAVPYIVVHNPNGEHLDRFRQFLGAQTLLDKRPLC